MKNKKIIAASALACLVWVSLIFCVVVFADTTSSLNGGSGTWIANLVGYTYSGTVTAYGGSGDVNTDGGASVSASASGNTLTVSAKSAKYKAASACESSDKLAGVTQNTITVTNIASNPIRIKKITTTGEAVVQNIQENATLGAGEGFTIIITASPQKKMIQTM